MDWFLYDNGLRHERVKCRCNRCTVWRIIYGLYVDYIICIITDYIIIVIIIIIIIIIIILMISIIIIIVNITIIFLLFICYCYLFIYCYCLH